MADRHLTVTLTAGDVAENHVGMQQIGTLQPRGILVPQIIALHERLRGEGIACKLHDLDELLVDQSNNTKDKDKDGAYLLVVTNGLAALMKDANAATKLLVEQTALQVDTKFWHARQKRVMNKRARYNLCFAASGQAPDFEHGKGTIVAYDTVPLTKRFVDALSEWLGNSMAAHLCLEGNYYETGTRRLINFHGDGERRIVVALRLGETMPLYYQWFHRNRPVGKLLKVSLKSGDIYIMSEKAVGFDWMRSSIHTLRHAAGENALVEFQKSQKRKRQTEDA